MSISEQQLSQQTDTSLSFSTDASVPREKSEMKSAQPANHPAEHNEIRSTMTPSASMESMNETLDQFLGIKKSPSHIGLVSNEQISEEDEVWEPKRSRTQKILAILKVFQYFVIYIFMGFAGNALAWGNLFLEKNTHSTTSQIGWLFTARALGYVIGSLMSGRAFDFFKERGKKLPLRKRWFKITGHKLMIAGIFAISITTGIAAIIPWLWLVIILFGIQGLGSAVAVIGCNLFLNWMWGKRATPFLMFVSFGYGVGSLMSPVIVAQLVKWLGEDVGMRWAFGVVGILGACSTLLMYFVRTPKSPEVMKEEYTSESQEHDEPVEDSPNDVNNEKALILPQQPELTTTLKSDSVPEFEQYGGALKKSPSQEAFLSTKAEHLPSYGSFPRIKRKVFSQFKISKKTWVSIYLGLYLFFMSGAILGYTGLLQRFVTEKKLMDVPSSSYLLSAFYVTFTVARLLNVPIGAFLDARLLLVVGIILTIVISIVQIVFVNSLIAMWISNVALGFALSPQYPTVLAVPGRSLKMNTSGGMMSIIIVGSSLGEMTVPLLITNLFPKLGADSMLWCCLVCFVLNGIMAAFLFVLFGKLELKCLSSITGTRANSAKEKVEQDSTLYVDELFPESIVN